MTDSVRTRGRSGEAATAVIALVLSASTLVCCALPLVLVGLGLGASVAALVSAAPWLVTLSVHKGWMFGVSGAVLAAAAYLRYRPGRSCPADPKLAAICARFDRWNRSAILLAAAMWAIGFTAAFIWLPLRRLLDA
jgi:hypothetical protein